MQIGGQTEAVPCVERLQLERPGRVRWELAIRPLPLGFSRRLKEQGVCSTAPPLRVARDRQGRVTRDERGEAVVIEDRQDAGWLAAQERYHQRVAVLAVWEATRHDGDLRFLAVPPEGHSVGAEGWNTFADALLAELEEFGFTVGELAWLCDRICRLSGLSDRHVQAEAERFFDDTK